MESPCLNLGNLNLIKAAGGWHLSNRKLSTFLKSGSKWGNQIPWACSQPAFSGHAERAWGEGSALQKTVNFVSPLWIRKRMEIKNKIFEKLKHHCKKLNWNEKTWTCNIHLKKEEIILHAVGRYVPLYSDSFPLYSHYTSIILPL